MKSSKRFLFLIILVLVSAGLFAQAGGRGRGGVTQYNLTVNSNVKGTVYIDSQYVGATGSSFTVNPGSHTVTVKAGDYLDYVTSVDVSKDTSVYATLQPLVYKVQIGANIPGAQLTINGKNYGFLSFEAPFVLELKTGQYDIKVFLNGYYDYNQRITVGKDMNIQADLKPMPANVTLVIPKEYLSDVKSAINLITLTIDGVPQKGMSASLMAGPHMIGLTSGGLSFSQNFNLAAGMSYTLSPDLKLVSGGK